MWFKNEDRLKNSALNTITLLCAVITVFCAVKYSNVISKGILNGLSFCFTVLIPSLFIFMVIAQYVANSRLSDILSKLLGGISARLFGIPKQGASAVIMSLIGGYPVGARCVSSLYQNGKINEEQAKKLSLIAVNSGPGFVLNFVGGALLSDKSSGIILFVSQIVAFFVVSLIVGRCYKIKNDYITVSCCSKKQSLVETVEDSIKATANMCAMVIVFCSVISVCESVLKDYPILCDALTCMLEVTTACNRMCNKYPLYLVAFAVGFSGLCVHFQIFSALKNIRINKLLFFFIRIVQGITASVVTYILVILIKPNSEVFSTVDNVSAETTSGLFGCCALILTAVCFLNSLSNTKTKRR